VASTGNLSGSGLFVLPTQSGPNREPRDFLACLCPERWWL